MRESAGAEAGFDLCEVGGLDPEVELLQHLLLPGLQDNHHLWRPRTVAELI